MLPQMPEEQVKNVNLFVLKLFFLKSYEAGDFLSAVSGADGDGTGCAGAVNRIIANARQRMCMVIEKIRRM